MGLSPAKYWFGYDQMYLLPVILSAIVLMVGILAFLFARKSVYRKSVLGSWLVLIAVSIGMIAAGLSSKHFEQPSFVRDTLLVTGIISTSVTFPLLFVIRFWYERASVRTMHIKDLLDK